VDCREGILDWRLNGIALHFPIIYHFNSTIRQNGHTLFVMIGTTAAAALGGSLLRLAS